MKPRSRTSVFAVAAAAVLLTVTACGSSGGSGDSTPSSGTQAGSQPGSDQASGSPIKVGIITSSTGSASSGYQTTEIGVKAYVDAVNAKGGVNGHKIEYVIADDTSTAPGALTAAQQLVQKDDVFAVISVTPFFFGAEPYLLKEGVPAIGTGFDGPEWLDKKNTNMFDALGVFDPSVVFTTEGEAVKKLGGTTCGAVGYIESPSATQSTKAFNQSCLEAGLKAPYVKQIHFGSTDVGPIALKMKSEGVDALFPATVTSTAFALAQALKENGVTLKAMLNPQGYGSDLLKSKTALKAAQGFYFTTSFAPVDMKTPATQTWVKRLAAAGEKLPPNYAESTAYISMAAFARGLQEAGASPTRESFTEGLRKVTDFTAEGLLATPVDFSDYSPTKQCLYVSQLSGNTFHAVKGLDPICGTKVPGK